MNTVIGIFGLVVMVGIGALALLLFTVILAEVILRNHGENFFDI